MLSAANSGLVAGSVTPTTMDKDIEVKVVRAFLVGGKPQPVGAVVKLPASIANEVLGMGKAVRYIALPPAPVVDATAPVKESKK
jgi:hypothetical protein